MSEPLNNFMIRLGYLKYLARVAHRSATTQEALSESMIKVCTKLVEVDLSAQNGVFEYILRKNLNAKSSRYSGLKSTDPTTAPKSFKVELQDYYLADPALPSNLGAVPKAVQKELVQWGTWIGIIHPTRNSLSPIGRSVSSMLRDPEKQSFKDPDRANNPFRVGLERYIFLYMLISRDGGLLRHLLPQILDRYGSEEFTRVRSVKELKIALHLLREELQSFRSSRAFQERKLLGKLISILEKEDAAEKKRALTGIMRISPRLENFVDLGLITKPDKFAYSYVLDSNAGDLFRELPQFDQIDDFLLNSFFSFAKSIFRVPVRRTNDSDEIFDLVNRYHMQLEGGGYKPIRELALVVGSLSIENDGVFFEAVDLLDTLERMRRDGSKTIAISGGKTERGDKYVMIKEPVKKWSEGRT